MWWRTEVHRRFSSYRIYYISRLFDNLLTGFQCNLYTFFMHWGYYLSTLTTRWAWEPKVIEDRPNPALQDLIFLFVGECYQFFLYACVIVMKHITTNVGEPNVKVLLHSTRYVVLIHGRSIRLWFDESLSHSQFTLFWYNYLPFDTCQGSNSWWTFWNSSLIIFRTDVARSVVMRSISTPSLKMRWLRPLLQPWDSMATELLASVTYWRKRIEIMQGSKMCAFRRHNATRNVRFAGTTRSMCSKRYPEPVDIKVLTVGASVWEL